MLQVLVYLSIKYIFFLPFDISLLSVVEWLSIFEATLYCHPWIAFCVANAAFYSIWTTLLFVVHFQQMVLGNVTTNERMNVDRYVEFSGGLSGYGNKSTICACGMPKSPYNRGLGQNLVDLCRCRSRWCGDRRPTDWANIFDMKQLANNEEEFIA